MNKSPDLYLIKCDWMSKEGFGTRKRHITFVERDEERMSLKQTIEDILSGEVTDVVAVYRFNVDDESMRDVSHEIAEDLLRQAWLEDTKEFMPHLIDFLEHHLGCRTVADASRELEAGR